MNKIAIVSYTLIGIFLLFLGYFFGATSLDNAKLLKDYETYFVAFGTAILGVGGIIIQLRQNEQSRKDQAERHETNRQQEMADQDKKREQEIQDQRDIATENKRAIAACLIYEIHENSGRLFQTLEVINKEKDYLVDVIIDTHFFEANLSKLGCLDAHIVYHIAQFYGQETITKAALKTMRKAVGEIPVINLTELQIQKIKVARFSLETFIKAAEYALPALARMTNLPKLATIKKENSYSTNL